MMPIPFMSDAPRPQMYPSRTSPASGSTLQCSRSKGTTSVWLSRISDFPREPSPSSVALAKREEFLADPATANEIYAVQTLGKQAAIVRAWTEICDDPSGAIYRQDSYAKIEAVYPDRHAVFVEAYENS